MIYLNTHPGQLDTSQALALVSVQRREKALSYLREEDRKLSLAVYLLLMKALEKEYGITGPQDFAFGPHGKPFLQNHPHIHFNLSHCAGAALCAVSDSPVGCDIETVEASLDIDLCRRCCSREEQDKILQSQNPPLTFCTLWTRKEALLKYTGEGLTDSLPGLLATPQASGVRLESTVAPDSSFVYTVCRPLVREELPYFGK